MASTYEEIMAKSRELYGAGDMEGAKRLAKIAISRKQQSSGGVSQLSTAFQQATMPQAGPPMPPEMLMRNKAKNYYTQNDMGAGMSGVGGFAQGGTFGFSDEITAALQSLSPNVTYDQALAVERGRLDAARQSHPVAAYGGEVAGAIAAPGAVASSAPSAVGRVAAGAASGALQGGIYGFGTGEGGFADRAKNAATGGAIGGVVGGALPALGYLVQKGADARAASRGIKDIVRAAPSTEELRAAGQQAYGAIDNAGLSVKPEYVQNGLSDISTFLGNEGVKLDAGGKIFPASRQIMDVAQTATQGQNSVALKDLDILRRFMGSAAASNPMNKADTRLALDAMGRLDEMVSGIKPEHVDAGDLATVQELLPKARDLWAKMSRSQLIDDAVNASGNYMGGAASGIRNQFASILRNKKLSRGFSDVEKAAMRKVVTGSLPEQAIHLLGGGMGNIMSAAGGYAGGGWLGGIGAGGIAMGARKLSEGIVRKNAETARALVASGTKELPKASNIASLLIQNLIAKGMKPTYAPLGQAMLPELAPR